MDKVALFLAATLGGAIALIWLQVVSLMPVPVPAETKLAALLVLAGLTALIYLKNARPR